MDKQLELFLRDYQYFRREWLDFIRAYNETRRELIEMRKELGVREGKVLAEQISDLQSRVIHQEALVEHVARDVTAIRRLLDYNELNLKEVMKALTLIYRNVDELEDGLLPTKN